MESKTDAPRLTAAKTLGLLPFILLYGLLAALQGLFPLLAFGPSHYGALALRLSGWALLWELAAPLLFGGLMLAVLLLLWGRRDERAASLTNAVALRGMGDVLFLALTVIAAFVAVWPRNHIGQGLAGAPFVAGLALSLLWQAAVVTGFAVVPVYAVLPALRKKLKPGAAAWATLGIVLLIQAAAMALFRLLWQTATGAANLFLLDVLPNAIAPVIIGWIPVMLAILVCQRSRKGSLWPAMFAASASAAVWALLATQVGAVLAGMGLGDSTYLILVHLVFAVLMLVVFVVMNLLSGKKRTKK